LSSWYSHRKGQAKIMVNIGIVGAAGYTGAELLRLLAGHPEAKITALSELEGGKPISDVFPSLRRIFDVELMGPDAVAIAERCDVIFCGLPHRASMKVVPEYLDRGVKVVDLSADFRFKSRELYEKWYVPHASPKLLEETVYGLPELYREDIKKARLIGNPGCYPTGAILALAPLVKERLIDPETIIVDSKSGVTGAGKAATETTHFVEVNEGIRAYGVATHRHTPEIEDHLSRLAGRPVTINFTPHLVPMDRCILSVGYATLLKWRPTKDVLDVYNSFYKGERFVRVHPEGSLPRTNWVKGSNYVDIGLVCDDRTGRVVAVSAIDNLVKGASGQAIQNMNIIMGLPEEMGLTAPALYP